MKHFLPIFSAALMLMCQGVLSAAVIVNDSWLDAGRDDGVDPLDTNWWTTSTSSAIEVSTGSLGLVSGSSGRGIRATFAPQTLAVGDTLTATYTFATPDSVGNNRGSAFRIGLYDKLGRAGLEGDLSASSSSPQPLYDGLPGYMSDFDINTGSEDVRIRKHNVAATTGRLLGTTSGYDSLGGGGDTYSFAPNTAYVGMFSVTRTGADTADITSTLLDAGNVVISTHTETDASGIANNFGMLAFHANSNTFGSSNSPGDPDNGIDFSNVTITVTPAIPEPTSLVLLLGTLAMALPSRKSRR